MVKNIVARLLNLPYFLETPGDGSGGGGTGDGTPGAVNDGAAKPGSGSGDGKPSEGTKPGAGGSKPVEDPRIKGLIEDLRKERVARQKFENDHRTTSAELERERKRVLALSGIEPRTKEQDDEALIRQRMETLYPWMKDLTSEDIQALKASQGQIAEIRNATTTQWKAHGQKMLTAVTGSIQKALGGSKLSERQADRIQRAYVEEARSNPEFLSRHESGDQTLIDEFVQGWLEDFVEPGKRSALQQETQSVRRPRVPGGKDRSIVGANDKPIDVKDDKAVEDILVRGFKERGGQFGRR